MALKKILIVEDETAIADTLIHVLEHEGFEVLWAALGSLAIEMVATESIDLMILDVGLPDINGFEVCKIVRQTNQLPIIFVTARGEEIDRVVGLEIGGDDYVTKPFSPREVAARVKVILKRVQTFCAAQALHDSQSGSIIRAPSGCDYCVNDQLLGLTSIEFKLLDHLIAHPNQVLSREQLLNACGHASDSGYERNIDSHIKSIRRKVKVCHPQLQPIKTHRGFGYCYQASQG